ncbi:hypothetical protein JCGZ_26496 [Jatropha curcas]|uniref:Uncharacterized protein n=1 Tax=Jatropha curcas TaxID=180498 RepID=A0A067L4K4_JATCU|nr:hypothetical protein JCGZ_26496 [Jatropha curcas]
MVYCEADQDNFSDRIVMVYYKAVWVLFPVNDGVLRSWPRHSNPSGQSNRASEVSSKPIKLSFKVIHISDWSQQSRPNRAE